MDSSYLCKICDEDNDAHYTTNKNVSADDSAINSSSNESFQERCRCELLYPDLIDNLIANLDQHDCL